MSEERSKWDCKINIGSAVAAHQEKTAPRILCALTGAKCVGIELAKDRADKAEKIGSVFRILASHLGKEIGSFGFVNLVCNEDTVIFVNNFVFDPTLQNQMEDNLSISWKTAILKSIGR